MTLSRRPSISSRACSKHKRNKRCFAVIGFLQPPAVAVLVEERYGQSLRRALLLLESESMFPRVLCRGGTLRNWPFSDEEPVPIPALFFGRFVQSSSLSCCWTASGGSVRVAHG